MTTSLDWQQPFLERLGAEISAARQARGMSAVAVSEAVAELGIVMHRVAVSRIEKGAQAATAPELVALGAVLQANWVVWLYRASKDLVIGDEDKLRADLEAARAKLAFVQGRIEANQTEIATLEWEEIAVKHEVEEAEQALAKLLGQPQDESGA